MQKIIRAKDSYLIDDKGNEIIDCTSGGSYVSHIGYGVEEVINRISDEAIKLSVFGIRDLSTESEEGLKILLKDIIEKDIIDIMIFPSWEEAFKNVLKLIRNYSLKHKVTIDEKIIIYSGSRYTFQSNSIRIPPPFCYRCPYEAEISTCGLLCIEKFENKIIETGPEKITAFIAEPITSFSPAIVKAPFGYYEHVCELCQKYNIIFVVDEKVTCGGRTGQFFAIDHSEINPDIIITGNGLSGGYLPIGALIVLAGLQNKINTTANNINDIFSIRGSSIACACSISALTFLQKEGLVANAKWIGDYLLESLKTSLKEPVVDNVRGLGLYIAIDIISENTTISNGRNIADFICDEAMKMGLLLSVPDHSKDDNYSTIICAPTLNIGEKETNKIIESINVAITNCSKIYQL